VNDNEDAQQAQARQMDHAGTVVTAEKQRQKMELNGLVDRQTRQHHYDAEQQYAAVAEALKAVVEIFRQQRFSNPHIIRELPDGVRSIAAGTKQTTAPFTAGDKITQVDKPVDDEEPRDREMPTTPTGQPSSDSKPRGRRHVLKGIPPVLLSSGPNAG
jgi:hypothetical protein